MALHRAGVGSMGQDLGMEGVSVRYAPPLGPATPDEILFLSKFRLMGVLFYLPWWGHSSPGCLSGATAAARLWAAAATRPRRMGESQVCNFYYFIYFLILNISKIAKIRDKVRKLGLKFKRAAKICS